MRRKTQNNKSDKDRLDRESLAVTRLLGETKESPTKEEDQELKRQKLSGIKRVFVVYSFSQRQKVLF
jgi:hypothetical protein